MASNINPANVDGTYPIAGQDNDSQGFRDNFTNIKNNFTYAQAEISDLQSKVVLKSALTGASLDNSFVGAAMNGAQIVDFRETVYDFGTTSGTITVNHKLGHYQKVTLPNTGTVPSPILTLAFSNFPAAGQLGRVRVEFNITDVSYTVQLPTTVTINNANVRNLDASKLLTFDATGRYTYEFTTTDGGTNYAIMDLSRSRTLGPTRTPTATGQHGDVPGMMTWSSTGLYVCIGYYDGSTTIWKKATLGSV